ncbi:DUF481 domain-containing protein [Mucilaginibacter jinjuensis]|uniref:DUF481 domain-containing protein n=1 Tax=Mucilaginibacter jinjuensis TaxID=1176721 RepID=A0ABY7TEK3_9SPHI|nr:DUF481 domain-containing protein [Mucilaginibacter jinjuensis]WCT14470.1 hypothetical protein PQO05_11050 [Mucilaginibacter jinjuensis]
MRSKRSAFGILLFLTSLFMSCACFAQTEKDTLVLNNGERLIGELKQILRGMVTFDSDDIGLLTIKTYKVRSVHTTISTLRVETIDRMRIYGKLQPSGSKDTLYVVDGSEHTKLAINDISTIASIRNNFFDQLDGNVSAGLSFARSSSIGQFNLNASVKHTSRWLQSELSLSELGSIDSSRFSLDQEKEQVSSYHYIKSSAWFAEVALSHQRNVELSLAHRYQGLLGAGNKIIKAQTIEGFILTGIAASKEISIEGLSPRGGTQVEIPVMLKLDYFKFSHPNMQVSMTNTAYVSLSQSGRYRYDGNLNVSWTLITDFSLTTNLYGNFDSKPLDAGSAKTDYGLVVGIAYKF